MGMRILDGAFGAVRLRISLSKRPLFDLSREPKSTAEIAIRNKDDECLAKGGLNEARKSFLEGVLRSSKYARILAIGRSGVPRLQGT